MHFCRTQCAGQGSVTVPQRMNVYKKAEVGGCHVFGEWGQLQLQHVGSAIHTLPRVFAALPRAANMSIFSALVPLLHSPGQGCCSSLALHTGQSLPESLCAAKGGRRPLSCKTTVLMLLAGLSLQTSHILAFPGVNASELNTTVRASINLTVRQPEMPVAVPPLSFTWVVPPPPLWHLGENESLAIDVMTPVMSCPWPRP